MHPGGVAACTAQGGTEAHRAGSLPRSHRPDPNSTHVSTPNTGSQVHHFGPFGNWGLGSPPPGSVAGMCPADRVWASSCCPSAWSAPRPPPTPGPHRLLRMEVRSLGSLRTPSPPPPSPASWASPRLCPQSLHLYKEHRHSTTPRSRATKMKGPQRNGPTPFSRRGSWAPSSWEPRCGRVHAAC